MFRCRESFSEQKTRGFPKVVIQNGIARTVREDSGCPSERSGERALSAAECDLWLFAGRAPPFDEGRRVSALFAPLRLAIAQRFNAGLSTRCQGKSRQGRKNRLSSLRDFIYLPSGDPNAKALGYFRIREVPTSDAQKWPEMFAKPIAHQRAVLAILVSQVFAPLNMTG